MEMKILNQKKNPFMEREEYTLEITNEIAPSFEEVKTELKQDADLTVVKKVNTNFGRQTFIVEVVVYDNAEVMKKVETVPVKIRKKMEAEAKAAVEAEKKAAAEAKKAEEEVKVAEEEAKKAEAETPAEETKEESPAAEETKEEEKTE